MKPVAPGRQGSGRAMAAEAYTSAKPGELTMIITTGGGSEGRRREAEA